MDADDDQPDPWIALVPRPNVRHRAEAIDAAVGPEVDQHDLAAKLLGGQRRTVDPWPETVERRHLAFDRKLPAGAGPRGALSVPAQSELFASPLSRSPAVWAVENLESTRVSRPSAMPARRRSPARRAPGGSIRSRRATPSSARTPCRRPAAQAPASRRAERIGEQQDRSCRRSRPGSAAPVKMMPRIGPAHGAHKQARRDAQQGGGPDALLLALRRSDRRARQARPAGASRDPTVPGKSAPARTEPAVAARPSGPTSFARTAQPPPTAASVATIANVSAMPASIGNALRAKLLARAREHERQHRQDARAQDRQHAAEIGEQQRSASVAAQRRPERQRERRSCNSAGPSASDRRRTRGRDARRIAGNALPCGSCRTTGPRARPTAFGSGAQKLGQPVPLSNFVVEENRSDPQPAQANTPLRSS